MEVEGLTTTLNPELDMLVTEVEDVRAQNPKNGDLKTLLAAHGIDSARTEEMARYYTSD